MLVNIDYLGFELNVGSLCNFKCRYCFEGVIDYTPTKVSKEYLDRYSEYICFLKKEYYKDKDFIIRIYGGEPLLQYENIIYFISKIKEAVSSVRITTNGYLIKDLKDNLLELKNMCKSENLDLQFGISYDFVNQDEMRQKDSSKVVLDSIKWLYNNGFKMTVLTVFTNDNIYTFSKVFFEYIKLKYELPELTCSFAIDRSKILKDINFDALRKELIKVKTFIEKNNLKNYFFHRGSYGKTRVRSIYDKCFHGDIFVAMNHNGELYPGYDVPYESNAVKNLFYIGHISEDFTMLENNRLNIIKNRPENLNDCCINCNVSCRVYPWKAIKNSYSEWWNVPDGEHCKLYKLIGEYF